MGAHLERYPRAPVLKVLVDPLSGVPALVERQVFVWPVLALCAAVTFSGVAFGLRVDPSAAVLKKMEAAGELSKASERELHEEIQQAQRVSLVAGAAKGILLMPLELLAIAVALKLTAWLLGKKLLFAAAFSTAAVAFLPIALFHLLFGVIALRQEVVVFSDAAKLVPASLATWLPNASPNAMRALAAVDFFNLWAAVLVGLGFAAGTKARPALGIAVGVILYVAVAALFAAAPGLATS